MKKFSQASEDQSRDIDQASEDRSEFVETSDPYINQTEIRDHEEVLGSKGSKNDVVKKKEMGEFFEEFDGNVDQTGGTQPRKTTKTDQYFSNRLYSNLEYGNVVQDVYDVLNVLKLDEKTKTECCLSYHRNSQIRNFQGVLNPLFQAWLSVKSAKVASSKCEVSKADKFSGLREMWSIIDEFENEIHTKFEKLKIRLLNELKTCDDEVEKHFLSYIFVELFTYLFVELRDICCGKYGREAERYDDMGSEILELAFSLCKDYMKSKFDDYEDSTLLVYVKQECYSKREILSVVTIIRSFTIQSQADNILDNSTSFVFFFKCLRSLFQMNVQDESYMDKNLIIWRSIGNLIKKCIDRDELEKAWLLLSLNLRFVSGENFFLSGTYFISFFIDLCSLSSRTFPIEKIHDRFRDRWHEITCIGMNMGVEECCSSCFDTYIARGKHYLRMGEMKKAKYFIEKAKEAVSHQSCVGLGMDMRYASNGQIVIGYEALAMLNMKRGDWNECLQNLQYANNLMEDKSTGLFRYSNYKVILEPYIERIKQAIAILTTSILKKKRAKNRRKQAKVERKMRRDRLLELWDLKRPEKDFRGIVESIKNTKSVKHFFDIINGSITDGNEKISDYLKRLEDEYLVNTLISGCDEGVCEFCKKGGVKLKRCSRCRRVKYCSRKCQANDWKRGHKKDCSKDIK